MGDSEKPTPEEIEKAADGLLGSLARSYGMDKSEVLGVMARKYGGKTMGTPEKATRLLGDIERHTGTGDPMDRMMQFELLDDIRDRRETRKIEREKKLRAVEEDDNMAKGSGSSGFDMDKMMQYMMMKAMMKDMGGSEKNETIEIMKLRILAGGDSSKMDMTKLEETMRAEREANKEDRDRLLEAFTDKQEKDNWTKYMEDQAKRQEERDAAFMEELRNIRRPEPETDKNKIVAAAEEIDTARKSLETVGAIKPATEDERRHELTVTAQRSADDKERTIIGFVDKRITEIGGSLDRKLETFLQMFAQQQRIQAAQVGIALPTVVSPSQPAPPQGAPPPGTIPREELYARMQAAAAAQQQAAEQEGQSQ